MSKYFRLSPTTFAADCQAALESYYGDGAIIESASGTTIIFKVPAVCDKVLKFVKTGGGVSAYIGDTSSSMKQLSYSYGGTATEFHLILSEAFILVDTESTSSYRDSAFVAKLTNGRYMVAGGTVSSYSGTHCVNNKCCFTDTMVLRPIRFICPYNIQAKSNGKLCLLPSFVADDQEVELNADGTFASVPGMWLTTTTGSPVKGSNYYLSNSNLKGLETEGVYCYTQKYVELDME